MEQKHFKKKRDLPKKDTKDMKDMKELRNNAMEPRAARTANAGNEGLIITEKKKFDVTTQWNHALLVLQLTAK